MTELITNYYEFPHSTLAIGVLVVAIVWAVIASATSMRTLYDFKNQMWAIVIVVGIGYLICWGVWSLSHEIEKRGCIAFFLACQETDVSWTFNDERIYVHEPIFLGGKVTERKKVTASISIIQFNRFVEKARASNIDISFLARLGILEEKK